MGIAQKIARDFAEGVRARGQSYFAKGRVGVLKAVPGEVVAKVRGTETYRVRLRMRGLRLLASCSCPYFGPFGEPCKHLWATILVVDARGLLSSPPVRPLELVTILPARPPAAPPDGLGNEPGNGPANVSGNGVGVGAGNGQVRGPGHVPPRPPQRQGQGQGQGQGKSHGPSGPPQGHGQGRDRAGPKGPRLGPHPHPHPQPHPHAPQHPHPHPPPQPRLPHQGGGNGPPPPPQGHHQAQRPAGKGKNHQKPQGHVQGQGQGQGPGNRHAERGGQVPQGRHPQAGKPASPHGAGPGHPPPTGRPPAPRGQKPVRRAAPAIAPTPAPPKPAKRLLVYVVDAPATLAQGQIVIDLARRERRANGDRGPLKPWWNGQAPGAWRPDPDDRLLLALLDEAQAASVGVGAGGSAPGAEAQGPPPSTRRYVIDPDKQMAIFERLCRAGRTRLRRTEGEDDPPLLRWDDGAPWRFAIDVRSDPGGKRWSWRGSLRREDQRMDLAEPLVLLPGLVILGAGRASRFDDVGLLLWASRLRQEKEIALPEAQHDAMLGKVLADSRIPPSELIESLRLEEVDLRPRPRLTLRTPRQNWGSDRVLADLEFDYEGARVPFAQAGRIAVQSEQRRIIHRDEPVEAAAAAQLVELGFKEAKDFRVEPGTLELPPKQMARATRELVGSGWIVEAEGKLIRPAAEFKLAVTTGIDWFELGGQVDFGGGQGVPLPELLDAARRGDDMVTLGDGSMGMLPEDWLKKYGLLAEMADSEGGGLRFGRAQAGLLDALLAAQPEIRCDDAFARVREQLHGFGGVESLEAPEGFRGELRPYQREGLGWLDYLRRFELGGILADDMGLGKTIQVLALLQRRKLERGQTPGPSLIVVPRSLVYNWIQEAAKFTPDLRVLDYAGTRRTALRAKFAEHDLVITTYGILRTDAAELNQTEFDAVILDEAQAIKNATSQAAKAARLLRGRQRLAMSGTPIENHLGELWSIFEFLNPGMLGTSSVFKRLSAGNAADAEGRATLARALKPFILRRTKGQVVKDLPEKTELTLSCTMEPAQRRCYEELRAHYRQALLRKGSDELKKSKIEVLEALLRLRQAACHPGLIDPARAGEPSAKLDLLLPHLAEVVEEGHKALVFSQFTSLLALVKTRLDEQGLRYEYLDGRTRNRIERVERFQNDPDCPIFLISLKAGGLGLNLTAAEYVYLLDPWWNPAVEAQAIDRSHRIGQTQRVFAYRLIARDTVEQKILELQQRKRDLADAILNADNRLIRTLSRDDLEFLLS